MWPQERFHTRVPHFDVAAWWGKLNFCRVGWQRGCPVQRPQGWWKHPCTTSSSRSTMKIHKEGGWAQLNLWKFRGQNAALGKAQGRLLLLLLKKTPGAFMHQCHFFLLGGRSFSVSFLGFSVSWAEALAIPVCQNQCSPALPSPPTEKCDPGDCSPWHTATAEVHCRKKKL